MRGRAGWLPAHLWETLRMLRTASPGLEARDTCVPGCRRMGVGLSACRRNQFRLVVSRLLTRVRFRVVPGARTQEFGFSLPGTAGRQEAGAPYSRMEALCG